jgi:hypothetical protein
LFGGEKPFYEDGLGIGVLVGHGAVGAVVAAELRAEGKAEVVGQSVVVDHVGARVLGVGQRRGRRGEQRRVRRRQRSPAGQRSLRILRRADGKCRRRLQGRLDGGNVDARADQKQALRG